MKYPLIVVFSLLFFQACESSKNSGAKRAVAQEIGSGSVQFEIEPSAQVDAAVREAMESNEAAPSTSLRPQPRNEEAVTRAQVEAEARAAAERRNWDPPGLSSPNTSYDFNSDCDVFIQPDGSYGEWGLEMIDAMRAVERHRGYPIFFGNDDRMVQMGRRCKSSEHFQSLSRAQQEHVWVWLWASIAQDEASCNPAGKNGSATYNASLGRTLIGDGMFQLEHSWDARKAAGRNSLFCPHTPVNSQSIEFQSRCAASTMAIQRGRFLMLSTSYWEKVRPGHPNGEIFSLLRSHPLCQ